MSEIQRSTNASEPGLILLTGATGYVGGRLLRALEQQHLSVKGNPRSRDDATMGRRSTRMTRFALKTNSSV